jgi:nitroimidazol reductase NimA-like FMN-containing flavoprotein (pyridoxamine 5'-phosphate oxidase superfamily)
MIKELDEETARKLLNEQKFGHLGCILEDGEPYVVAINYLYRDGEI